MRVQREEIQIGGRRFKRMQGEDFVALAEGRWARLNSGGMQAVGARRGRHSAGRCKISRRSMGSSRSESCQEF